jgi:hypothetical protein
MMVLIQVMTTATMLKKPANRDRSRKEKDLHPRPDLAHDRPRILALDVSAEEMHRTHAPAHDRARTRLIDELTNSVHRLKGIKINRMRLQNATDAKNLLSAMRSGVTDPVAENLSETDTVTSMRTKMTTRETAKISE